MPQLPKRYYLASLWLELTRGLHKTLAPDLQSRFGARTGILLIDTAVFVATLEGRPMTATRLSASIGIPRPTVDRHLRILCRNGTIERAGQVYVTSAKQLDRLTRQNYRTLTALVRTTSEILSR
ncbi:helix-turn-helix domain-containing protein [Bradyrhizobium sp. PMVTL-01]|uniref:helix-turn-helix domain-containing protein n=1 Tax=Bradyrhizobium sp. PMVTL-01 TaxID=3434999 RepID=UPI003F723B33